MMQPSTNLLACLVLALSASSSLATTALGRKQPQVSLWHMFQDDDNDTGDVVFWDSETSPVLADAVEFLHTRQTAPTGVAYEIDVTASQMTLTAGDVSQAESDTMPANQYDRYYLFIDQTQQLTTVAVQGTAPTGVTVSAVPKGTILTAADRNNHLHLDFELRQDAVLIELGPGVALNDATFQVVVNYERIVAPEQAAADDNTQAMFEEQQLDGSAAVPSNQMLTAGLLSLVGATLLL